jgi:hypothetical protein
MMNPRPPTPDQMPIAFVRSSGGKTLVMMDRVPGMSIAAPRPMTERAAIKRPGDGANAPSAAAAPNTTSPRSSTRLRPKRSPRAPPVTTRPAKTMLYAAKIHCRSLASAPSSLTRSGIATLRIVIAIPTNVSETQSTARIQYRRSCSGGVMAP